MKKLLSLLLTLTLVFTLVACGKTDTASDSSPATQKEVFSKPENYAAVLLVKINPEFNIYLDNDGMVLAIESLNDDAKSFSNELNSNENDLQKVINNIISKANEKGFIKSDAQIVFSVSENKSDSTNDDILLKADSAVTQTAADLNIKITVNLNKDNEEISSEVNNIEASKPAKSSKPVKSSKPTESSKPAESSNPTISSVPTVSSEPVKTEEIKHTHSYSAATCTEPKKCSCGATESNALGHNFKDGKCTICGTKDPDFKEFDTFINGVGYTLGQILTVDIILKTNDTDINICPFYSCYEKVNNTWQFSDLNSNLEDLWGEEISLTSSHGGPEEEEINGQWIAYGHWRWMGNFDNEICDFSQGETIIRLKYTVNKKGNFELRVRDGAYDEQNNNKYTNNLSVKIYK